MTRHHVPDELIQDYAAGALSEAQALVVATHMALCPQCRRRLATVEAIGGALLEDIAPAAVSQAALAAVLDRLDEPAPPRIAAPPTPIGDAALPEPLRSALGMHLADVPWQRVLRGLHAFDLGIGGGGRCRMLRIAPGVTAPQHTHVGSELTLVLDGAFADKTGEYARGDLAVADDELGHTPTAIGARDCICLVATEHPLRLTGPLMRWLNPFVRF